MFKEWVKGSHVELVRNPNYFARGKEGKPYIDRLVVRFIPDPAGRILALKKGDVDFLYSGVVPFEEVGDLRKDPKITVDSRGSDGFGLKFLLFNLRQPQLAKKAVRQAIAYGIDKQKILNFALAGEAKLTRSFVPESIAWAFNPKVPEYSYNPQKANELLDKAGLVRGPEGIRFKLRINLSGRGSDEMIAEVIRDCLRMTGIDVQIINTDLATYYDTVFERWDFDMFLQPMPMGPDPSLGVPRYLHSKRIKKGRSLNSTGYSNPEVDKLFDAEQFQTDPKKRAAMWHRIQEIVMDDLPLIPINETSVFNCYRSDWADIITRATGAYHSRENAYLKK